MKYLVEIKKGDVKETIVIKNKKKLQELIGNSTSEEIRKMKIKKF